jgi:hypothetical protein
MPALPIRRPVALGALVAAAVTTGLLAAPSSASAGEVRIHDIQGGRRISPLAGKPVTDVPGTVTAIRAFGSSRGFWFQDPDPDRDRATSEGVFVFTGSKTPDVAVGDAVLVSGTVSEYYGQPAARGRGHRRQYAARGLRAHRGRRLHRIAAAEAWQLRAGLAGVPRGHAGGGRHQPSGRCLQRVR